MSNTIKLKRGSGSDPSASDLSVGEIAIRTDSGKLFTKKDNGSVAEISGSGGIDDGDKGDITVSNGGDTFTIDSGVIDNANIASNAAIAGSKISPDFGSQTIATSGVTNLSGELRANANIKMTNASPKITFTDAEDNPDFEIGNLNGIFRIRDATNSANRLVVNTDGHVDVLGNLDVGSGLDVTGNITTTSGNLTVDGTGSVEDVFKISDEAGGQRLLMGNRDSAGADCPKIFAVGNASLTIGIGDSWSGDGGTLTNQFNIAKNGTITSYGNHDFGAGIDVTGNITVTGTVDGRDVASDGSKLDGIESNATADQTASEILTLIKTVDGAGSGLNADVLDGISSASFLRSDAADTCSGVISFTAEIKFGQSYSDPESGVQRDAKFGDNGIAVVGGIKTDTLNATGNITCGGTVDGVDIAARNTLFGGLTSSSGVLTNGVTATTQSAGNNTTRVATTAFVSTAISNLINGAPSALDTLNELAAAMNDDAAFSTTVTNSLATKMPLAGGQFTGNITFSGSQTVDGRDLSVDGSKLDGIESGATADQSASEILTLIKTVDGAGSGLDADLLDGISSTGFFVQSGSWLGDLGSNGFTRENGLNMTGGAEFVILSKSGQGHVLIDGSYHAYEGGAFYSYQNSSFSSQVGFFADSTSSAKWKGHLKPNADSSQDLGSSSLRWSNLYADTLYGDGANITNVNATTLDSIDSGSFVRSDAADTISGDITFTDSGAYPVVIGSASGMNDARLLLRGSSNPYIRFREGNTDKAYIQWNSNGNFYFVNQESGEQLLIGSGSSGLKFVEGGSTRSVYHTGNLSVGDGGLTSNNFTDSDHSKLDGIEASATADQTASEILTLIKTVDGAGSGLDADTLDGVSSASFLRSDTADTMTGNFSLHGNLLLTGDATTTNQDRTISFTGFDKESTSDFTDNAFIRHTTNTGGLAGSVLEIGSVNDSNDGIAFNTNGHNNNLRLNSNIIWNAGNDGSGSGLDSDLLDGQEGSYYRNAGNINAGTLPTARLGTLPQRIGLNTSVSNTPASRNAFLALGDGDTGVAQNGDGQLELWANNQEIMNLDTGEIECYKQVRPTSDSSFSLGTSSHRWSNLYADTLYGDGSNLTNLPSQTDQNFTNADHSKLDGIEASATADQTASEILTLLKTVDGDGSGLDADTLDGISSSSFLRSDANDTMSGNLTASGTFSLNGRVNIGNSLSRPAALDSDSDAHCRIGGSDVYLYVASLNASGGYKLAMQAARGSDFASFTLNLQANGGELQRGGNKVWDAGNDGSGSGLDSDTVDGIQGASLLRSDAADTASGDITFSGGAGAATIGGGSDIRLNNGSWTGDAVKIQHHNNYLYVGIGSNGCVFREGGSDRWIIDGDGHFRPSPDSTHDIGTNSVRVRNGYFDNLYGDGSNLTGISAGATGGGSDEVFYENSQTVTTSYTITNGKNAMAAGPITINSGVTVTVGSGETLTIV